MEWVKNRMKRIVVFGESASESSPALTLREAFCESGILIDVIETAAPFHKYLRAVWKCELVVVIAYDASSWLVRRVMFACLLFKPCVRWWVGTDVYRLLVQRADICCTLALDRFLAENLVVSDHLVDELLKYQIGSQAVPIIPVYRNQHVTADWQAARSFTVVVYFPYDDEEYYGASVLDEVIPANPDIRFILLRSDGRRYADLQNVEALSWLDDLTPVYDRSGCLLRITKHDGLPRMILEALKRGLYVIYSWPLEGCRYARTPAEVNDALANLKQCVRANEVGCELVEERYGTERMVSAFEAACRGVGKGRLKRFWSACRGLITSSE